MRASLEKFAKGVRGALLKTKAARPVPEPAEAAPWPPTWFQALLQLDEDAPVGDAAMEALHAEISARACKAGASQWRRLQLSNLRVRNEGTPEWWSRKGNMLLAAPGAKIQIDPPAFALEPGSHGLVVAGEGAWLYSVTTTGEGGLLAAGDHCNFYGSRFALSGRSSIVIGENSTSSFAAFLDSRNGGAIIVGADNMWANGVNVSTDDDHAIRDVQTGERLNVFGGNIIIEPHVWLCGDVHVLGDSRIGTHTVVGQGSFVKSVLPANSVCVGRPARPVRSGITWTREDLP